MDIRRPGHTALSILGLCFVLALLGRGLGESFTVFLLPISESFGWDRAEVISIYAIAALCGGLASPLIGRLFDRSGPRIVYALGLALVGIGFSVAAFAQQLWQVQICIGLGVGLGAAAIGNVPSSILLGRWFGPRLPTAMAILYSAAGAGTLMMLPTSQLLIDQFGWRGAYQILGGTILLLVVPLVSLPWRRFAGGSVELAARTVLDPAGPIWTLSGALRHHAFWALFSTFFFTSIGMFSISAQVVAYLVDVGFSPLQAATAWGSSGVLLLVGMLTISWLDGVIGRQRSVLLSYGLTIAGIVLLWLLKRYPNTVVLAAFVICFGGTLGSRGPLITSTAMKIFRGERVGTIYGTISIGSGLGAAIGAWSGGLIHDLTGGYDGLIAFALVSVILGMTPFLTVRALKG